MTQIVPTLCPATSRPAGAPTTISQRGIQGVRIAFLIIAYINKLFILFDPLPTPCKKQQKHKVAI